MFSESIHLLKVKSPPQPTQSGILWLGLTQKSLNSILLIQVGLNLCFLTFLGPDKNQYLVESNHLPWHEGTDTLLERASGK